MTDEKKPTRPKLGEEGEHPLSVLLFSWMRSEVAARAFLAGVAGLCALFVALEFLIPRRIETGPEDFPAFFGVIGFLSLGLAVLSAWPLGHMLRRPENYYGDEDSENETGETGEDGR